MQREGPPLETLTRRLAETPEDFLAVPCLPDGSGTVHVAAVIHDLLARLDEVQPPHLQRLATFTTQRRRREQSVALLICWLLGDEWFPRARPAADGVLRLLAEDTVELTAGGGIPVTRFVTDPDRREELVRLTLDRCGARPAGETVAQARDRLTALSSVERSRVLRASRAAEERARAVREALAKKAAAASADKDTRE